MADTADFQTMYAMLKVHSANQAKEIEILKERLSTPPADAALIGKLRHQLAQVTEECAALRARAVPDKMREEDVDTKQESFPGAFVRGWNACRRAMLAASKAAEGK